MAGPCASGAARAAPEKRVALIIGVGAYANVPHLPNPANDARLIEQSLTTLGFDVETVIDPNRDRMARALGAFGRRGEGAAIALFFYAGHGIQVSGHNYLLPTDAVVDHESDLRYNAFDVQDLLDEMDEPGRVNLVFLDACRDNPFARSLAAHAGTRSVSVDRGLSRDERIGAGSLIAYATDPGSVATDGDGADSPFSLALSRYIAAPGLELQQIMTRVKAEVQDATHGGQRPWDSSNITHDVYLTPPEAAPPPAVDAAELAFWTAAQSSNDIRDVEAYLAAYPHGHFSDLARDLLDRLRRAASAAPMAPAAPPAAPPIDNAMVAQLLKAELRRVGCYAGPVDGGWDKRAADALLDYDRQSHSTLDAGAPGVEALKSLSERGGRVCPLVCPRGQSAQGDRCVVAAATARTAQDARAPPSPNAPAAPRGRRCDNWGGVQYCE